MEQGTEHVVKSCRNLVQTEIKSLRTDIGSLRGFLRSCQDTISEETQRLEKKCLGKIENLQSQRGDLEAAISKANEENENLRQLNNSVMQTMKDLELDLSHSHEIVSQLKIHVKSLESQLATKATQCKDFCKKLEANKLRCLALENKLASNEAYMKEQKSVLHEISSDNKHLECNTKDLQMRAAESEEYERALESHIEELEAICAILREQHDEQQKYFLQKETSLKRESHDIQRNLKEENKELNHEIDLLKSKLESESLNYAESKESAKNLERRLEEKENTIMGLTERLDLLKHEIQIELATVEMLTRKNNDLTQEVAKLNSRVSFLEKKTDDSSQKLISRNALTKIGSTVQQYMEESSSFAVKLETSIFGTNNEKLEECERQLVYERQKRLNAEMEAANLSVELEKVKVQIAMHRSNASDSIRKMSSHNSTSLLALPGLGSMPNDANCRHPHELILLASSNGGCSSTLPSSDNHSQHIGKSNDSGIPSGTPIEPAEGLVVEQKDCHLDSHSVMSDVNNAFWGNEISISDRASRKMEEATRRAIEMLNKSCNSREIS